jgi:hypothetical protein
MQLHFDNIIATMVAGIVILILAMLYRSGQASQTDAAGFYHGSVQTEALVDMIERDFTNIGAGAPAGSRIVSYQWSGNTGHFEFRTIVDTTANAPAQQIRYTATAVSSPVCQQAGVSCVEVVRTTLVNGQWQVSGRSASTLSVMQITPAPLTGNLADVREVAVRMESISPFGEGKVVRRNTWQSRFRPVNLAL